MLLAACGREPEGPMLGDLDWHPCGDGLRCATFRRGGVDLAVTWHPAVDEDGELLTRRVAVMAAGGPGGSSVDLVRGLVPAVAQDDPELWAEVNWVGLDNRGVGASAPITCVDGGWFDDLRRLEPVPRTEAEARELAMLRDRFQDGCLADRGPEALAELGTGTYADDLDALREHLDVDTIDLLGFSYGTWIGAVYASRHPGRVGRFVLDGVVGPHGTRDAFLGAQAEAFEEALERWFERCASDPGCAAGPDPAARFDAALAAASAAPLAAPRDPHGRLAGPNTLRWGVATLLYGPDDEGLAEVVATAADGDGTAALEAADAGWDRDLSGHYAPIYQRYFAIGCQDWPWPDGFTDEDVFAFGAGLEAAYPRLGPSLVTGEHVCVGWPAPPGRPTIGAPTAPAMLLVNVTHDPATPLSHALDMQAALGNGSSVLTFEGDGHVAMFTDATGCTYRHIRRYLLDGDLPAGASCP